MDNRERENIIGCLRTIVHLAGEATEAHRDLALNTKVVMNALDLLFKEKGLEPIGILFKKPGE